MREGSERVGGRGDDQQGQARLRHGRQSACRRAEPAPPLCTRGHHRFARGQRGQRGQEGRRAGGQEGKEGSVVPADVLSGSPLWEFSLIRSRVSGNFDPWGLMEVCPYCTKIHGSAHGSGHGSVQGRRGAPAPSMLHTWWLVGGYNDHLLELRRGCGLAGRADIKTPTPVAIQACASCLMPKFPRVGG